MSGLEIAAAVAGIVGTAITIGEYAVKAYQASQRPVELHNLTRTELNRMKADYGWGVCTLVSISNMTGADILFKSGHDYHGHAWRYPPQPRIQPGQAGVYLHAKAKAGVMGSKGAIVYEVYTPNNTTVYVTIGFSSPWRLWKDRRSYIDIREQDDESFDEIRNSLSEDPPHVEHATLNVVGGEIVVTASRGDAYSSMLEVDIGYAPTVVP